jgi:Fur family peroxide stress response transcriptional regulator
MENITVLLRSKGYKVTPQRLAIYEVLISTAAHPSAEMLFQYLQPLYPAMSLATVYKTIDMLKCVGVVTAINVGEDSFRYEIVTTDHPHLICTACHKVEDGHVGCTDFEQLLREKFNFTLHTQRLFFYGICSECKQASLP